MRSSCVWSGSAIAHRVPTSTDERVLATSKGRLRAGLLLLGLTLSLLAFAAKAEAASPARNSAIADKAVTYVGRWGGAACVDAGFSGYTGGAPLGDSNNMDGECRSFVNCILKMVLGINTAYGLDDYQRAFRENGGEPISLTGGMRGDIIQVGNGEHTAIITKNLGAGTYEVVDSNFVAPHRVGVHVYTPPSYGQIWRMGTVHIAIRSLAANRYVTSEHGYGGADYAMLRARATSVGSWERFTLVGDCSRACALRSDTNGLFVTAELGYQGYAWGEMRAHSGAAQAWEQWRFVGNCETSCGLLSLANGRFVSTELGFTGAGQNMLRARSTAIGGWEQYQIQWA
jgi:hypothetical protein